MTDAWQKIRQVKMLVVREWEGKGSLKGKMQGLRQRKSLTHKFRMAASELRTDKPVEMVCGLQAGGCGGLCLRVCWVPQTSLHVLTSQATTAWMCNSRIRSWGVACSHKIEMSYMIRDFWSWSIAIQAITGAQVSKSLPPIGRLPKAQHTLVLASQYP